MATGRRRICLLPCLALAGIFVYAWLSVAVLWPSSDNARLLAQDTLQAAYNSVHEVMRSLLEAYEDELRATPEWHAVGHSGTKLQRLQTTLYEPHQGLSRHKLALEEFSGPRSVEGHDIGSAHGIDICRSLAGKRIAMIGGEHIHRLHVLFLQHREHTEGKPFPCQFHEFCTHHHICLSHQRSRDDTPPSRYVKPPGMQELIETESAVVNYIVSDTLFSARDESSWQYNLPFLDPMTGIRLRETYWLAAARKANIIILGRGPLSAPGETYTGNWSFLRRAPDYVDVSQAPIGGAHKSHGNVHMYQTVPRPLEIVNGAVHLTVSRFLPDVFQLLRSIRREVRPSRRKILIWPSEWCRLPSRGAARTVLLRPYVRQKVRDMGQWIFFRHRRSQPSVENALALQLSTFINADITNTALFEDPWTLLFNAQVYLQNMVLTELLPRYGITYLPFGIPWVDDTQTNSFYGAAVGIDAERMTGIGEAFLTRLDYVLRYLQ